jgi:hypothetical protein
MVFWVGFFCFFFAYFCTYNNKTMSLSSVPVHSVCVTGTGTVLKNPFNDPSEFFLEICKTTPKVMAGRTSRTTQWRKCSETRTRIWIWIRMHLGLAARRSRVRMPRLVPVPVTTLVPVLPPQPTPPQPRPRPACRRHRLYYNPQHSLRRRSASHLLPRPVRRQRRKGEERILPPALVQ